MRLRNTISVIALGAFLTASLFLLFCPQMTMAQGMKTPCAGATPMGMSQSGGESLKTAPTGCLQTHVAFFRSLIFVVPDWTQILSLIVLLFTASALATLWRERLNWWRIRNVIKLKLHGRAERFKTHTKNFLSWLTLLEQRSFASC
ncbi:MAG: hypothetical protein Q7K39_01595 [Candidatus Magasanikbacteria bacterium]|nr:hypothetical protein [Candidatus Magasanikbacteria bacterium]